MRAWLLLLALAGCDRVFGLGDPYEDARATADVVTGDTGRAIDGDVRGDGMPAPVTEIAHFTFDDTFNDTSGTYIGTDIGSGLLFVTGHKNHAVAMDGTSCVEITVPNRLASFTIAFWAKPTDTTNSGGTLFAHGYNGGAVKSYRAYASSAGGAFGFSLLDGTGATDGLVLSAFALDTWRHYAITFDGSTKTWWVDAAPQKAQVAGAAVYGTDTNEYIGCDDGVAGFFTGQIDELYIYDGAMDQSQLQTLASQ